MKTPAALKIFRIAVLFAAMVLPLRHSAGADAAGTEPAGPELAAATPFLSAEGKALVVRGQLLLKGADCSPSGGAQGCHLQGSVWLSEVYADAPLGGYTIERVWLIQNDRAWTAPKLAAADGKVSFSGGPQWPPLVPVAAVVKVRGVPGLVVAKELIPVRVL